MPLVLSALSCSICSRSLTLSACRTSAQPERQRRRLRYCEVMPLRWLLLARAPAVNTGEPIAASYGRSERKSSAQTAASSAHGTRKSFVSSCRWQEDAMIPATGSLAGRVAALDKREVARGYDARDCRLLLFVQRKKITLDGKKLRKALTRSAHTDKDSCNIC